MHTYNKEAINNSFKLYNENNNYFILHPSTAKKKIFRKK